MRGFNNVYESIYRECQGEIEKLREKRITKKVLLILTELSIATILYYLVCQKQTKLDIPFFGDILIISFIFFFLFAIEKALNNNNDDYYNKIFKEKVIKSIVKGYSEKLNYNSNVMNSSDNVGFYNKSYRENVVKALEKQIRRNMMDNDNTKMELNNKVLNHFLNSDYTTISNSYKDGEFEENFNNFYYEDTISGQLNKGHNFTMAEIKTEKNYEDIKGDTIHEQKKFHGIFVISQFEHKVDTIIKVRNNANISLFSSDIKLEMDSSEFEKIFNVYAEDKIIAMQLLTADIMQMLIDFKNETNIVPEITIKNNNLYIRLKTGDMFEGNTIRDSLDYSTLKKYYDTIKFTVELSEKMVDNIVQTEI